ncbi:MAG: hypothetical protein ACKOWI_06615, partial [Rhodoluna sp.]
AMLATVSLVGVFASILGFFSADLCTVEQLDGWTSCAAIEQQRQVGSFTFLALSIIGFSVSIIRIRKLK